MSEVTQPQDAYPGSVIVAFYAGAPLYGVVIEAHESRRTIVRLDGIGPHEMGENFYAPPPDRGGRWCRVIPLSEILAPVRIVGYATFNERLGCQRVLVVERRLVTAPEGMRPPYMFSKARWLGTDASLRLVQAGVSNGAGDCRGARVLVGRDRREPLRVHHHEQRAMADGHTINRQTWKRLGRALGMELPR